VPSAVRAILEGQYLGWTHEQILTGLIEGTTEGLKVSFSYKEAQSAYCVALTLPDFRSEGDTVCATFWDGELFDALLEAWTVYDYFEARRDGFYNAKARISEYEKDIARQIKRFQEERNTPVTTRHAP